MANNLIQFPSIMTYYISYNTSQTFYHWGENDTDQQTENALDTMEIFTVEQDYIDRTGVLGIELE